MFIYSQGNRSALTNTQETLKVWSAPSKSAFQLRLEWKRFCSSYGTRISLTSNAIFSPTIYIFITYKHWQEWRLGEFAWIITVFGLVENFI
jgi:hypothetical protein